MIGGFGVIAWPATYGNSGVMTFMVNHDGVVYEKDSAPGPKRRAEDHQVQSRQDLEGRPGAGQEIARPGGTATSSSCASSCRRAFPGGVLRR
jgi:hypothetical protein